MALAGAFNPATHDLLKEGTMKLNERHGLVTYAKFRIDRAIRDAVMESDLTYGELTWILAESIAAWSKIQVRDERSEEVNGKT